MSNVFNNQGKEKSVVVIDPPWYQQGGGKIKRGADRHYQLMKQPEIIATCKQMLSKHSVCENAHFYIWVTNNQLPDGLELMSELGARYITNIVWVKPSFGMGYYFRGQHELILFGVKGNGAKVKTNNNSIPSVIFANKRKHSQKPVESYELIESRSRGEILYLFSRQKPRDRWSMEGYQVGLLEN